MKNPLTWVLKAVPGLGLVAVIVQTRASCGPVLLVNANDSPAPGSWVGSIIPQ